jgi:hypothetical protein
VESGSSLPAYSEKGLLIEEGKGFIVTIIESETGKIIASPFCAFVGTPSETTQTAIHKTLIINDLPCFPIHHLSLFIIHHSSFIIHRSSFIVHRYSTIHHFPGLAIAHPGLTRVGLAALLENV